MASYELLIKSSAVKELERLESKDRRRVVVSILDLSSRPRPAGCEKLSELDRYRIRQGHNRVVYRVHDATREVIVFRIGHRQDACQ